MGKVTLRDAIDRAFYRADRILDSKYEELVWLVPTIEGGYATNEHMEKMRRVDYTWTLVMKTKAKLDEVSDDILEGQIASISETSGKVLEHDDSPSHTFLIGILVLACRRCGVH